MPNQKIKTINYNGTTYDINAWNADYANELVNSRTIDGIVFTGRYHVNHYTVCNDASATKILSVPDFQLVNGARLIIRFNITTPGAASPSATYSLNINNTGAKQISYQNLNADQQLALKTTLNDGTGANIIEFVYDETLQNWLVLSAGGAASSGVDSYGLELSGNTLSLVENGATSSVTLQDSDRWFPNDTNQEGYVASPGGTPNKVWKTDNTGKPRWLDDQDTTYNIATSSTGGLTKLGSDIVQTIAVNTPTSVAGKTYPVQLNSSDQMVVNVPWNNDWHTANTSEPGTVGPLSGIATEYLNGTGQWSTPPNDVYTNGAGLTLTNHEFKISLATETPSSMASESPYSMAYRQYPVVLDSNNKLSVNVPWTDSDRWDDNTATQKGVVASPDSAPYKVWKTDSTGAPGWRDDQDTTYSQATSSTLGLIKIASDIVGDTANTVTSTAGKTYAIQLNSSGQAVVNVPWNYEWKPNAATQEGYVANPNNAKGNIWMTNITTGEPQWTPLGDILAVADAMLFKGTLGASNHSPTPTITSIPTSGYKVGDTYRVVTAGTYGNFNCEIGDLLIAVNDGPAIGSTIINGDWTVAQTNIDGALYKASTYANGQMLIAQGTAGAVASTPINPYVTFGVDQTTSRTTITSYVGNTNGDPAVMPAATTTAYGVTKLYDGLSSTSVELAATANSVKAAYDKATESATLLNSGSQNQMLVATGNSQAPTWKTVAYTALNTGYTITNSDKLTASVTNSGVLVLTHGIVGITSSGTVDVVTGFNGVVSSSVPNGNEVSY